MQRSLLGAACALILGFVAGCGDSTADRPTVGSASPHAATGTTTEPTRLPQEEPIVARVREFLQAVIQGDSQGAFATMTPQAVASIESNKVFDPQGLDSAAFRIGQIRMPSESEAVVQCFLSDSTTEGGTQEELCCMLRCEGGRWGISGIAFQVSPQQPPYILNFEQPDQSGPDEGKMAEFPIKTPPAADPTGQPPVETAQQPGPPLSR